MASEDLLSISSPVQVAVITDQAYLPWSSTTVASCALTTAELCVHLIHTSDVTAHDQQRFAAMAEDLGFTLRLHQVDPTLAAALPSRGAALGGPTSWVRVALPMLLPELDRVLYLDADTLAVESLGGLWQVPLDESPIAAVPNVTEPAMRPHVSSLGLSDPDDYFNAGVLVVDLARWREEGATDALVRFATERIEPLAWFDQDALNVIFAGRWQPLHPRWNAMNSLWRWRPLAEKRFGAEAVETATAHPAVLHFEGPSINKPWHYLGDHPWRPRYHAVRARTPWAEVPLEGRTAVNRLIARLPSRHRPEVFARVDRARQRVPTLKSPVGQRRASLTERARSFARSVNALRLPAPVSPAVPTIASTLNDADRAIVTEALPFSMTSTERLVALIDAVEYLERNHIPGAFVECGVWRGGSVLAMVRTLQRLGITAREVYLYDTFTGMTEPTDQDTSIYHEQASATWERAESEGRRAWDWAFGAATYGREQVRQLLAGTGYPSERLHFVVGPVEETLPADVPDEVALLRLDTDWYESTRHELIHLYPRVSGGGVLIVDDYGHWAGARRAVDEYFAEAESPILLSRIDYTGRIGVKR